MVRNVKFKPVRNNFLSELRNDANFVNNIKELLVDEKNPPTYIKRKRHTS